MSVPPGILGDMTTTRKKHRGQRPSADACAFCRRPLAREGTRRITAGTKLGVLLCSARCALGRVPQPARIVRLAGRYREVVMVAFGAAWTDEAFKGAALDAQNGRQPWVCRACSARTCQICGGPPDALAGFVWTQEDAPDKQPDCEDPNCPGYWEYVDPMYEQAVALVRHAGSAGVSDLQRRLQIGYRRASRLMVRMEHDGTLINPSPSR